MDNRYSTRPALRPLGRGTGPVDPEAAEEDPLVELARIVSGQPFREASPRRRSSALENEPGMSEADLARDLEAELLSDLHATLGAARPDERRTPVDEEASGYDAGEPQDDYYPDEMSEPEPDYGADEQYYEPAPEPSDETYRDPAQGYVEDLYPDSEPDAEPEPPAPSSAVAPSPRFRPRALPKAVTDRAFASLNLRRDTTAGPAYNPGALPATRAIPAPAPQPAPQRLAPPPPPPPEPEPQALFEDEPHPFEEVARQRWDSEVEPPTADDARYHQLESDAEPAFAAAMEAPVYDDGAAAAVPVPPRDYSRDYGIVDEDLGGTEPRRRGRGILTVVAFLAFVAVAAAVMIYLRGGSIDTGTPPLITADASPIRILPETQPAPAAQPGDVIYNRIDPQAGANTEVLNPAPEAPAIIDPAPVTDDPLTTVLGAIDPVAAIPAADQPRTVRTVTVNPDGTVVNNQVVGANGEVTAPPNQGADAPVPLVAAAPAATPAEPAALPPLPAAEVAATPVAEPAVTPPAPVGDAPAAAAAAAPATPAPGATIGPDQTPPPGTYVQVTAQATEQLANASLAQFRAQAPQLLTNVGAVIQRAEVNGSTVYRVRFGPFDRTEATNLCSSLRGRGIDCFLP